MSSRNFQMRLSSRYEGDKNTVVESSAEVLNEGVWEPFELSSKSAGFMIFVFSLLGCQHLYFRTNCAERDLVLESSVGHITIGATQTWEMESLNVDFSALLQSGDPKEGDVDYILSRMKQCPVSKNVIEPDVTTTEIVFQSN